MLDYVGCAKYFHTFYKITDEKNKLSAGKLDEPEDISNKLFIIFAKFSIYISGLTNFQIIYNFKLNLKTVIANDSNSIRTACAKCFQISMNKRKMYE